jgi:hypothetical protein
MIMIETLEPKPQPEGVTKMDVERVVANSDKGILTSIREWVNSKVAKGTFPSEQTLGYKSSMGIYGGDIKETVEGKMIYDVQGFWNRIDQWGDRFLRSYDDHHARNPLAMAWRKPGAFIKILPFIVDSKRYRGTPEQALIGKDPAVPRVAQLGLQDMYGLHPNGIEIKQPEVFKRSIGLQDIFRADKIKNTDLLKIDRFQALAAATDYMWKLHQRVDGGIAEGNIYSFLFAAHNDGKVSAPYLMIPTEIYNPEKKISPLEQKATDLLDLLASAAFEEMRRSNSTAETDRAINTVLESYADEEVISMVSSYLKRGRLTLPNDLLGIQFETTVAYRGTRPLAALHNTQRLTVDPELSMDIRQRIQERCDNFVNTKKIQNTKS